MIYLRFVRFFVIALLEIIMVALHMLVKARAILFVPLARSYVSVDEDLVESLLRNMTAVEKMEQLCIPGCPEAHFNRLACDWRLLPSLPDLMYDLRDNKRLGVRGLRTRDGPRGLTCSLGGVFPPYRGCPKNGESPAFPQQSLQGATWDTTLMEELGRALGEIGRILDVHVALGPTINIMTWLNWGRGQETYGEDPWFNGRMGAAMVRGVQAAGVMACPKHFLANNIENTRWWVSADMDDQILHEVYLKAWATIVAESSPEFVMTSYNRVQGMYPFATEKFLQLLRTKIGFKGSVTTDWFSSWQWFTGGFLASNGLSSPFRQRDAFSGTGLLLHAGNDVEMPFCSQHFSAVAKLETCEIHDSEACQLRQKLDVSVRRILRSKLRYGLVGVGALKRPTPPSEGWDPKFWELSLKISRQGIVLLRNEAHFLPKAAKDVRSVAVLGTPEIQEQGDKGSSFVRIPPGEDISVLRGLQGKYGQSKVFRVHGEYEETSGEGSWRFSASEMSILQGADLVLLDVGYNYLFEGEFVSIYGGDRKYLTLHRNETSLIKRVSSINPNVVVAMSSGQSVIVDEFVNQTKAILWLGYPGPGGGQALAEILTGDVAPSGRMPSSTPRQAADWVPKDIDLRPGIDGAQHVQYPHAHGFKHMWGAGIVPRYPLGWGLTYTEFRYDAPALRALSEHDFEVTVEITNVGQVFGSETVQVYGTCAEKCTQKRLPILLLGFSRIELNPGDSATVIIGVSAKELAVYDVASSLWLLEKGVYTFFVGPCASIAALKGVNHTFEVDKLFDYGRSGTVKPEVDSKVCEPCKPAPDAWVWKLTLPFNMLCTSLLFISLLVVVLHTVRRTCRWFCRQFQRSRVHTKSD